MTLPAKVATTLLLALLAVAGNMLNLPLFFGVHFIFGSVAVMLAVKLLGLWPALWVALAGGAYTWVLWGQPYAMLTFTLEALVVSLLYRRGLKNLVLADLAFWLVAGPIAVLPLYTTLVGMDTSAATMITLKQSLNGMFNALIAGLLIKLLVWRFQNGSVSWLPPNIRLNELIFHALLSLTLIAGATPVILNSQNNITEKEKGVGQELIQVLETATGRLHQQPDISTDSTKVALQQSLSKGVSGIALLNSRGEATVKAGELNSVLPGSIQPLGSQDNLGIWLPDSGGSLVNRWKAGYYWFRLPVTGLSDGTALLAERPAAPLIQTIENERNRSFTFLTGMALLSILAAFLLSRVLTLPLLRLDSASQHLSDKIRHQKRPELPESRVAEYAALSSSLQEMGTALSHTFGDLEHARSNLEQEVQTRTRELARTSDLLSNILAASTEVAIIATDTEGTITLFNTGAENLLGYSSEEVVGKHSPALFHDPDEIEERSKALSEQFADSITGLDALVKIPVTEGSESREWHYVNKQGQHLPVLLTVTAIRNARNEITGYLSIAHDITERKRNEQIKSEFISTVSHELRTPLTSVSGALGLVLAGRLGELPDKAEKILTTAHRNSQRLAMLINDLLDIEKIAAGKLHFDMQVQPIGPILEQALEETKAYGTDHHVKLELTGELSGAQVRVDEQRLKQVLANLLSNAIKFSPDGCSVTIDAQTDENHITVSVIDRGAGIPKDFQPKVFQKFAQADSSDTRQKGGTGLGLAITRQLIERMNGSIDFESVEGQGARFYFQLPLQQTAQTLRTSQGAYENTVTDHSNRILIVDDDRDVASLLRIILEDAGYRVDMCHDGAAALEALKTQRYDLISLDLMLPDINGLDIIRHIRNHADTADIPIVVVSAKMEQGRLELNGGADNIEWLAKPIDHKRLITLVKRQLLDHAHPKILHVEDDADLHKIIQAMVTEHMTLDNAPTLAQARSFLGKHTYDAVLLDIGLPDGSGWELIPEIKETQPEAAIIVLTGQEVSRERYDTVQGVLMKSRLTTERLLDVIESRILGHNYRDT